MEPMNQPPEASEGADQGDKGAPQGADAAKAITGVMDAITSIGGALQGSAPPEAMKDLQMAASSYKSFLQKMGMNVGEAPQAPGSGNPQVGGNMNAQSADMPMGPKGSRPVPV